MREFSNQFIEYHLEGEVCVITYVQGCTITQDEADNIVYQKGLLQEEVMIRRFVGIIHHSVNTKKLDWFSFSTEEALENVDVFSIAFVSEKWYYKLLYKTGAWLINLLIFLLKRDSVKVRIFTDIDNAIKWTKEI